MIARLTRLMILLQVLVLAGLSALIFSLGVTNAVATSVLLAALAMTLLRAFIIVNNFFLSGAWRQPDGNGQRVPLWTMAGHMLQEFWHSMRCWFRLFPLARPFSVISADDASPPVLLLHGYGANSGFWQPLSQRLSASGISHAAIDLEPVLGSIDEYAASIEDAAQRLMGTSSSPQMVIVGHSMGGLAARAWLRRYGSERLARLITLGTPHFGSLLAGYAMGINAQQMLPPMRGDDDNGYWLASLASSESDVLRGRMTSIYSRHDNIVSPQHSAHLPGARNIVLDRVGHVAMGFDERVVQLLIAEIRTARQNRS